MPAGLQTRRSDGTLSLDTTFRVGRVIGATSLGTNGAVNITVPLAAGKQAWVHGYVVGDQSYSWNYAGGQFSLQTGPGAGTVHFFYGER